MVICYAGAFLGILWVAGCAHALDTQLHEKVLAASLGANAVLIYGVMESKLAQPCNVIGITDSLVCCTYCTLCMQACKVFERWTFCCSTIMHSLQPFAHMLALCASHRRVPLDAAFMSFTSALHTAASAAPMRFYSAGVSFSSGASHLTTLIGATWQLLMQQQRVRLAATSFTSDPYFCIYQVALTAVTRQ